MKAAARAPPRSSIASPTIGNVYGTRRLRWNTTALYDLPVGRGSMFGVEHVRDRRCLQWADGACSSIFLQTGPFESPYFPSGQGDPSGTGSGLTNTAAGFDGGHRNQYADQRAGQS